MQTSEVRGPKSEAALAVLYRVTAVRSPVGPRATVLPIISQASSSALSALGAAKLNEGKKKRNRASVRVIRSAFPPCLR